MQINRPISRVLAAAVASTGFAVAPMPTLGTTLSCSAFSATPDGQGNITVNCTDASGTPSCTVSASPLSVSSGGGNVTVTASNCGTISSWTKAGSTVNTSASSWTDAIGANTSGQQLSFTYTVNGAASVTVTQPAAGTGGTPPPPNNSGWPVSCAGYSKTIPIDLPWGAPGSGNPRQNSSGFGNGAIVVARFTTPATIPSGLGGTVKTGQWSQIVAMRSLSISTTPCDFSAPSSMGFYGLQTGANNTTPSFLYQIGGASKTYPVLQPNTTYYINVRNTYTASNGTVVPTCTSGTCDIFVELDKPNGY